MASEAAHRDPPEGGVWDEPIATAPLVFLDLEMTGLRRDRDRVIEVCAAQARGGRVEVLFESLVKPDCGTFGSAEVHGIEPGELETAPSFGEIADRLEAILDGGVIVAHAAFWDVAFIEAELARIGRSRTFPFFLDTLTLSRRAFSLPNHSLSALCSELAIERKRAHRAADDVAALMQLWPKILDVLVPQTLRDLWYVRIGQRRARPAVVAASVLAAESGAPVRVRYRPAHRGPEDLDMRITAVRTDLDPPRVLGYLLASRSRRDLRADRILAIEPIAAPEPGPLPPAVGPRKKMR
ncbi:MAG TPA: 3'-5' exonuclease [Polyangiaceae bacterium]|nr:3'-5' exonuclease [Polyangiaceae bacterium]